MTGPAEGEIVLFCDHARLGAGFIDISAKACVFQPFHWYFFEGLTVTMDDGTKMQPRWLSICSKCEGENAGGDPMRFAVHDARWIGGPPDIQGVN